MSLYAGGGISILCVPCLAGRRELWGGVVWPDGSHVALTTTRFGGSICLDQSATFATFLGACSSPPPTKRRKVVSAIAGDSTPLRNLKALSLSRNDFGFATHPCHRSLQSNCLRFSNSNKVSKTYTSSTNKRNSTIKCWQNQGEKTK